MQGRRFGDCDRDIIVQTCEGLAREILGPRFPLELAIAVIAAIVVRVEIEWLNERARVFC